MDGVSQSVHERDDFNRDFAMSKQEQVPGRYDDILCKRPVVMDTLDYRILADVALAHPALVTPAAGYVHFGGAIEVLSEKVHQSNVTGHLGHSAATDKIGNKGVVSCRVSQNSRQSDPGMCPRLYRNPAEFVTDHDFILDCPGHGVSNRRAGLVNADICPADPG